VFDLAFMLIGGGPSKTLAEDGART